MKLTKNLVTIVSSLWIRYSIKKKSYANVRIDVTPPSLLLPPPNEHPYINQGFQRDIPKSWLKNIRLCIGGLESMATKFQIKNKCKQRN